MFFDSADANEFVSSTAPEDCCDVCGCELVKIQDEYSDVVECPQCLEEDDEYDGQPDEYTEWQDYIDRCRPIVEILSIDWNRSNHPGGYSADG